MDGYQLVLEEDGTEIDDDEMLRYYLERRSILILLGHGQEWMPVGGISSHESLAKRRMPMLRQFREFPCLLKSVCHDRVLFCQNEYCVLCIIRYDALCKYFVFVLFICKVISVM